MNTAFKDIENYLNNEDWRIHENANRIWSIGGLKTYVAEHAIARYTLEKVYPKEIRDAHINGVFHIHDLSHGISGYCAGWSLRNLLYGGFNGVPGTTYSTPPKHLSSALGQMMNFLGVVQQEWAGAQAFSSLDTLLAPYVYYDNLSYEQVKQFLQEFIYNLNVTLRYGNERPFTNLTFDLTPPSDLKDEHVIINGEIKNEVYGDFQDEMDMINKAFLEVMYEGDGLGNVFSFPIPTYNITNDFDWDTEVGEILAKVTAKFGIPYFQNCIGSGLSPELVRAMCCRLQLDKTKIKRMGGLFGNGDLTGSIGVVTLNVSQMAYLSKDESEFFELLAHNMDLAKESLEIKRKVVLENLRKGLMPYSKVALGKLELKNHFSTIGLVGMNEACLNLIGENIASKDGLKLAKKTLEFMRDKVEEFSKETGNLYNLEATPAEGCSYRLAKIDKQQFPDIITAGTDDAPYYTNSTQLPVDYDDLLFCLNHQSELQPIYTGGTVFHIYLGESPPAEVVPKLVMRVCRNTKLPYISITPTFSICPTHGYLSGLHNSCPNCGSECLVYSRVVGYLRPTAYWNVGKKQEFKERKVFRW